MKHTVGPLSLWSLIASLQSRFEARGMSVEDVDAVVIGRVGSILSAQGQNDEKPATALSLCPTEA